MTVFRIPNNTRKTRLAIGNTISEQAGVGRCPSCTIVTEKTARASRSNAIRVHSRLAAFRGFGLLHNGAPRRASTPHRCNTDSFIDDDIANYRIAGLTAFTQPDSPV